ncbi:MAG: DNA translocase FtsK, partial [Silicimonas sp.]|nr:DNA translocase FtsK [Silicimonas sp.]
MAFQARPRDPLFDSDTQAIIERRGKELIGLVLLGLAFVIAMALGSYSPDDPNWLSATDMPAKNLLGPIGAAFASPIYVIAGYGGWAMALVLFVWGARFVFHYGEEHALQRLIFAPIAVAMVSIYFSTHVPSADWSHSFGLGGLFGDTVLGAVLGVLPVAPGVGLKLLSLGLFLGGLAMLAFVLGFDREELWVYARYLLGGLILIYDTFLSLLGKGAVGSWRMARTSLKPAAKPATIARDPELSEAVLRATRPYQDDPEPRSKLRDLMPSLLKRSDDAPDVDVPVEDDRISARIADAVKNRVRRPDLGPREEPPLGQGARPSISMLGEDGEIAELNALDEQFAMPEPEIVNPSSETGFAAFRAASDSKPKVQHTTRKPTPSRRAKAEAQPSLNFGDNGAEFEIPPLNLLADPTNIERHHLSDEALEENARMLESVLDDYGVKGEIVSVRPGPVVTMYELEPAPGLKASRVIGLADDIARSMSALSARVSTVPGRSVIGIELPNEKREMVVLREMLSARDYGDGNQSLPLALGKNIGGDPVVANLAKMPHLLIAGTTGSGKSVAINTMILSLLYKLTPEECRLIMIDPKMLELSVYDGIPHLLSPVVTDPKKAVVALKWVVGEMEERYRRMSKMGVRNIEGFNGRVADALSRNEM